MRHRFFLLILFLGINAAVMGVPAEKNKTMDRPRWPTTEKLVLPPGDDKVAETLIPLLEEQRPGRSFLYNTTLYLKNNALCINIKNVGTEALNIWSGYLARDYIFYLSTPNGKWNSLEQVKTFKPPYSGCFSSLRQGEETDFLLPFDMIQQLLQKEFSIGEKYNLYAINVLTGKKTNTIPLILTLARIKEEEKELDGKITLGITLVNDNDIPSVQISVKNNTTQNIKWNESKITNMFSFLLLQNISGKPTNVYYSTPNFPGKNFKTSEVEIFPQKSVVYKMAFADFIQNVFKTKINVQNYNQLEPILTLYITLNKREEITKQNFPRDIYTQFKESFKNN